MTTPLLTPDAAREQVPQLHTQGVDDFVDRAPRHDSAEGRDRRCPRRRKGSGSDRRELGIGLCTDCDLTRPEADVRLKDSNDLPISCARRRATVSFIGLF
jgi:hypothetical protein